MTPRVLVTGASGFLGRHVLACLATRGWHALALGRTPPTGLNPTCFLPLPDAGNASAIRAAVERAQPNAILHLAGTTTAASLEDFYRVNTLMAAHLLEAALACNPRPRILLAGTAAEYGPVPLTALPVVEDQPCRPQGAYGITKLAQTLHGLSAAATGLPVVVARLFNPVGGGMPEHLALGSFAAQIARMGPEGGTLSTGNLDAERDFVLAEDVARIMLDLVFLPAAAGQVVNLCAGRPTSLRLLTERLIAASGRLIRLHTDPSRLGVTNMPRHFGSTARLQSLGLTPPTADPDRIVASLLSGLPPTP